MIVDLALLRGINILRILMRVSMSVSVAVRMIVKQNQSQDVRQQPGASHSADKLRVPDLLRLNQSLYRFEENR